MDEAIIAWLESTWLSGFMTKVIWVWPVCETLHFLGLSLLIGTIGLFDLRLLGFAKLLPVAAMHRLIPWGIFGFAINVATGTLFFIGQPNQYIHNVSFHLKLLFLCLAGINVLIFYATMFRKVEALRPGDNAPLAARVIAASSLFLWVGIMCFGRLLTFFRP